MLSTALLSGLASLCPWSVCFKTLLGHLLCKQTGAHTTGTHHTQAKLLLQFPPQGFGDWGGATWICRLNFVVSTTSKQLILTITAGNSVHVVTSKALAWLWREGFSGKQAVQKDAAGVSSLPEEGLNDFALKRQLRCGRRQNKTPGKKFLANSLAASGRSSLLADYTEAALLPPAVVQDLP